MQVYNRTMPSHSHSHSHSYSRSTSPYAPRPSATPNYTSGRRATSPPVTKPARPPSTALFPLPAAPPPARSQAQSQNIQRTLASSARNPTKASAASAYPPISTVTANTIDRSQTPMQFWKPPQPAGMPSRVDTGAGGRFGGAEEQARRPRSSSAAAYASNGGRTTTGVQGQVHGQGHGVSSASRQQQQQQQQQYAQPPAPAFNNYAQRSAAPNAAWPPASDYIGPANDRAAVPPASKAYPSSYSYTGAGVSHGRQYPQQGLGHGHTQSQDPPVSKASDGPRHWNAREAATARNIDLTVVPDIHQAIGYWPDQIQQLIWDLTSSRFPNYHRPLDDKDLHGPFSEPPLKQVNLILGEDARLGWSYNIQARHGMDFITLQDIIQQISTLMHQNNVSLKAFQRADPQTKWSIVRAYCRRTRKPFPPGMMDTDLRSRELEYFQDVMQATVSNGAPVTWTNLLVMDLLGDKVMFRGLCNIEQANKWLLKTTTREAIQRGE